MSITTAEKGVILIVDDTPTNLEILLDFLEDAGFKVVVSEDGKSAIEMAAYAPPDLILLDIIMPEMDGYETCRRLKGNRITKDIPVIFMTALSDRSDKVKGLNQGAVDYITKPFEHEEVLARVNVHLRLQNLTKKLIEQNERLQEQAALLDIATDAIMVRDADNKISFWNKRAENLYGWNSIDALGKNADELLYEVENLPLISEIQESLVESDSWQGELPQITKEGQKIIVQSRWTRVRESGGKPKSILVVNTDITEKKQLEKQFLRIQRLESLGTLASGIAHDFNNILTPILGVAQLLSLKLPALDKHDRQLLKVLEDSARRGAALVKQILSFARQEEGKRDLVRMEELLLEVLQIAQQTFPKSIEILEKISTDGLWTIRADSVQMHQVFMNLCVNARDAMLDGGTLSVTAENMFIDEHYARMNLDARIGSYVVISISDTGTGIPPAILERIFEPFFTTKELGKGTGLGLSTVMGIIKSHGGFVKVYSEVGKGTQFKVYLPVMVDSQTQPIENLELPRGQGELILVVDDELAIREITRTLLERYNYRVMTACDGIEAIALFAQNREAIDIVSIDMMMPEMDGLTTIRALQKLDRSLKIIATSGLASNEKVAEAMGVGVKAFLSKPYTARELLKTLKKLDCFNENF